MSEQEEKFEVTEKEIDATADILARAVIAGLVGLLFWCFGTEPKYSLGVAIVAFFISFFSWGD